MIRKQEETATVRYAIPHEPFFVNVVHKTITPGITAELVVHGSDTNEHMKNKTIIDPSNNVSCNYLNVGNDSLKLPGLISDTKEEEYQLTLNVSEDRRFLSWNTNNTFKSWVTYNENNISSMNKRMDKIVSDMNLLKEENEKLMSRIHSLEMKNSVLQEKIGNVSLDLSDDEKESLESIRMTTASQIFDEITPGILNGEILLNSDLATSVAIIHKMVSKLKLNEKSD